MIHVNNTEIVLLQLNQWYVYLKWMPYSPQKNFMITKVASCHSLQTRENCSNMIQAGFYFLAKGPRLKERRVT